MIKHLLPILLVLSTGFVGCRTGEEPPSDAAQAGTVLMRYLKALNEGRYQEAVALYGGEYDILIDYNPRIAPAHKATLLESGCKHNGFRCLQPRTIQLLQQRDATFHFLIEFRTANGQPFVIPPLEGLDQPPRTAFPFTVVKIGGKFLVQELPPYTP